MKDLKKAEILKRYELNKLDESTVSIQSKEFNFAYTKADDVVKEEFKGQYKYFGGLQCGFSENSIEYKNLENWLVEIAENILK